MGRRRTGKEEKGRRRRRGEGGEGEVAVANKKKKGQKRNQSRANLLERGRDDEIRTRIEKNREFIR